VLLAADPARHHRLFASTQGDRAALDEISAAQRLLLDNPDPDLAAMGSLAVHRHRLASRNENIPVELPTLWTQLGDAYRAEQIARSITAPDVRDKALRSIAEVLAEGGQWERAEELARTIPTFHIQAKALRGIAWAVARAGRWDEAEQLAGTIPDPTTRAQALLAIVRALAPTEPDRAIRLVNRAEKLAHATTDSFDREWALRGIARAVAERGQWDRAEQLAGTIKNSYIQAHAFLAIARAVARTGQWDWAERLAGTITDPTTGAAALCAVAHALAGVDPDRAVRLANEAEQLAHTVTPRGEAFWEDLARIFGVTDPEQIDALGGILEAFVEGRRWDQAEQLARTVPDPQAKAVRVILDALNEGGKS
jgi:tetratricopeptide (TPR) repeat protein